MGAAGQALESERRREAIVRRIPVGEPSGKQPARPKDGTEGLRGSAAEHTAGGQAGHKAGCHAGGADRPIPHRAPPV